MGYAGIGSFIYSDANEYFLKNGSEMSTGMHYANGKTYEIVNLEGVDGYGTELSNTDE